MTGAPSIAAAILTRNEVLHIRECIASLDWCDQIVLSDSFSDDGTVELARAAGASIIQRPFDNFAAQRNATLDHISTDWVFFVDADERATPELGREVRQAVTDADKAGWWVPRLNYVVGKLVLHGGYHPDYQLRLLKKGKAHYDPAIPVHEVVILDGASGYLENPLTHYNYDNWTQVRNKQRRYARLEAQRLAREGIEWRPRRLVTGPAREFYRRMVSLQGYRDGLHGLRLHVLLAFYYGFVPHIHLRRLLHQS